MTKIIAILSAIMLTSCVEVTPHYQSNSYVERSRNTSVSPKWEFLIEGSDIKTNVNYKYYPSEMILSNEMLLSGKTWNDFLKKYIESISIEKRDNVLKGLTRYFLEYDKVDKMIKFEPVRYLSGPYSSNSYVSLSGKITKSRANALLKFLYYGSSWIFAHRITVVADDFTWKSPNLKFYRDHYTNVWEYAYLDLDNVKYRKIADRIVSSKEVIVRFHGNQYYDDLQVTERMKKDISLMLKSIDAINGR